MELQFHGFQNLIPVWGIFILFIGAIALSIWTYWHTKGLSKPWKSFLITLRGLSFVLLLLLLLNPAFTLIEYVVHHSKIALILDNSQSTTIEKGNYEGEKSYRKVIDHLISGSSDENRPWSFEFYGFDSELFSLDDPEKLDLQGNQTDIDRALSDFLQITERENAVILISDGIVTAGRDPSATASQMPLPVYTIGIGDTTRPKDISIQRIMHNPKTSLHRTIPVETWIRNEGFPFQDIPVQLRKNGAVLKDTIIQTTEKKSVHHIRFNLTLEEEGVQYFEIFLPETEAAWTSENNSRFFQVDVRDDRIRVLYLACEMHPDVRLLRTLLEKDRQIQLEMRTWIEDARYIEGDLPDRPDTLDLVILHGFPHIDMDAANYQEIAGRFKDLALFFMASPGQNTDLLSSLFPGKLPMKFESDFSWHNVVFDIAPEAKNHLILDFSIPDNLRFIPVKGAIRNVSEHINSKTLLTTNYRGNSLDTPLLAVRTVGDRNISYLNGFNFFRYALSASEDRRAFYDHLFLHTVKWTASSPDDKLLVINPSETVFYSGDPVIFNAFLQNESGEPEENGIINLKIDHDEIEEKLYMMNNEGGGRYQLELDNLPQGEYQFKGRALRGDLEIDSHSGEFAVRGIQREFLNTVRDDELLRFIAQTTGGAYFTYEEVENLFSMIDDATGLETSMETISRSITLHRHPAWFIIIIILLTSEWAIRKYRSMA